MVGSTLRVRQSETQPTILVGTAGFEPAALRTPSVRATRLRYVPKNLGDSRSHPATGWAGYAMDLAVPRLRGLAASRPPVCRSTSHSKGDPLPCLRHFVSRGSAATNLVRASGFEPPTPRFRREYSNQTELRPDRKLVGTGRLELPRHVALASKARSLPFTRLRPDTELQSGRLKLLLCWGIHVVQQSPDALQRGAVSVSQRLATPRTLGGMHGRKPGNGRIVVI
jgi:hypothetical protein